MCGFNNTYSFFLLFLLIVFGNSVADSPNLPSNLELYSIHYVDPIVNHIDSMANDSYSIAIIIKQQNALGKWMQTTLRNTLYQRGMDVYDAQETSANPSLTLIIDRIQYQIKYIPVKRNWYFRVRTYRRKLSGTLSYFIKSGNEKILFSRSSDILFSDSVNSGILNQIENPHYPFTIGTKIESKTIKSLVEPIIITATTLSVVYLFYTLRSGS